MNQRQVLINRVINFIETLRHQLYAVSSLCLYNDLLILKAIVPELPKNILRNLLKQLKPHNYSRSIPQKESEFQSSLQRIMRILSEAEKPSPLLSDFLICAGYTTNSITCRS